MTTDTNTDRSPSTAERMTIALRLLCSSPEPAPITADWMRDLIADFAEPDAPFAPYDIAGRTIGHAYANTVPQDASPFQQQVLLVQITRDFLAAGNAMLTASFDGAMQLVRTALAIDEETNWHMDGLFTSDGDVEPIAHTILEAAAPFLHNAAYRTPEDRRKATVLALDAIAAGVITCNEYPYNEHPLTDFTALADLLRD